MMEDLLNLLKTLLDLGWPAIVLVLLYVLWTDLRKERSDHIQSIKDCEDKYEAFINERLKED